MDQSGVRWPAWPVAGAVGAGRQDELPDIPAGFSLTPSGIAEQQSVQEEVPDGGSGPEPSG